MRNSSSLAKVLTLFCVLFCIGTSSLEAQRTPELPAVRIDASGNMVAVWESRVANMRIIRAATKGVLDTVWNTPVTISNPLLNSKMPLMQMDAGGDVVVIWLENGTAVQELGAAQLPFGGAWTSPVIISAVDHKVTPDEYKLQINNTGEIVAIYRAFNTTSSLSSVYATTSSIGSGWSAPLQVAEAFP